ncbi:Uncharacterized conserved protein [Pseudomonas sp. LAMO17WK12:I10]|uniref:DUF1254 domain-containing protein n=1 Tax=unclassified Pseudomonas TaxID=196821 RepID=UPI000BC95C61|nr:MULTISPECIES: DUF1254 domain-containing protein [unclassified Pseudomonas]PXX51568.1 hypothetical protein H160_06322 [Pseudomonas sp. LAMO17WK12:I9]SNY53712.1 Uncharacterized conserved protein [Pseudomonas sp. LAMO17WK12:I10]
MMMCNRRNFVVAFALTLALLTPLSWAQNTPGYNNNIPPEVMTPARVQTRLGTLSFADGFPSKETSQKLYDNLDFMRGVETFLNFIPAASLEAMRRGMAEVGAAKSNQVLIMDKLLDSNPLLLTGNTDTVYAAVTMDLEKDGPTVVEVPAGTGPGTVNDAFFRFVVDMGKPGPDNGKGGKYLIVPPNYKDPLPSGYIVAYSPSYINWLVLRGFLVDGKPDAATKQFKEGLKVYPLAAANNPPPMEFISGSMRPYNTIHANDFKFYEELAQVIAKEPIDFIDPELRGLAASIGIRKGKPFAPDSRMKAILTEAVAVGNATARALVFQSRDPSSYFYERSYWKSAFVGGDYRWLTDGGEGGRNLDARTLFFYQATVNTPAMVLEIPGVGSQYAYVNQDASGNYLDGAKSYRIKIPANVPAKDFWSVVLYDPQTRSELQTSQLFPSKNSKRDALVPNADGSVELFIGPVPQSGKEQNWIQTVPGKNWYAVLRLYGPLTPWFDKSWRPGDVELVK